MRPYLFTLVAAALFVVGAYGQEAAPKPTPTPAPAEDGQVVKITTNLIQLDVSVTDKGGKTLTDLRRDEIEVYENGVKQDVIGFSFVSNPQPKREKQTKPEPNIPEPPVEIRPEDVRRTIALVIDDLTLSFESAAHTRRALKKYVDEQMLPGDLVGIIRTGAGIGALQQFTSNKVQLYAAIDRVKWNPKGVGRFGSFDPIEPTMNEMLKRAGDPFVDEEDIKSEREFKQGQSDFRESIFTAGTLGALNYIVNGMAELPGRKSVILFSDGLKIFDRVEGGSMMASRTMEFLKKLVGEANKKSVVFYPLDARGLEYTGFTAADQVYDPNTQNDRTQRSIGDQLSERNTDLFNSQQGLHYLAEQTGGFAYINKNDLTNGMQKVLEDQSYYLVAYQPTGETFDTEKRRFNKIEIKVNRDDTKVRHRSGFFVGEDEQRIVVDLNYPTKIMRALTSPFAMNGITVKLNALFGHTQKRGYFVHSFLHIDAGDLTFKKLSNGDYQANFDILAISYGDNGAPVEKNNSTGTTTVKAQHIERVRRDGFAYSFIFPVKKPGAYQMRVALIDHESKEVGSANQFINVPNLKKEGVTLSGIVLENVSKEFWATLAGGTAQVNARSFSGDPFDAPDPKYSTANRIFKRGSVLRYGVEIMNAKAKEGKPADYRIQTRVFHDRKLVFEGAEGKLAASILSDDITHTDAVELGEGLLPGDYVLQVIVSDGQSAKKKRVATQYVQFEVVE
jgi:VWFA-related protein